MTPIFKPLTSAFFAASTTFGVGALIEVESFGSWPAIASCSNAASKTVRAHGPP